MSDKYREIMEHVYVTDAMKARVSSSMRESVEKRQSRRNPIPAIAVACVCIALVAGVLVGKNVRRDREGTTEENTVAVVYDVTECNSVDELSEILGFTVAEIHNLPFEVEKTTYYACWKEYAEISYEGTSQTALYRVTQGNTDISGDYNVYDIVKAVQAGDVEVTLKGDTSGYVLAIWQKDGYSYSVAFSSPVTEEQIQSVIE